MAGGDTGLAFWRARCDPFILRLVTCRTGSDDPEAFDLLSLPLTASVLRDCDGSELILIEQGTRHLRLQCRGDSILDGPVRVTCELTGVRSLEPPIISLRRLSALARLGRLPLRLFPRDPVVIKNVRALQAWDAAQAGAGQRDIAIAVFGAHMVTASNFDSMRKRVDRLLKKAEQHISAAWHHFCAD